MQIDRETVPPLRLATITHVGPYNQIGGAFEQLSAIAGRAGLFAYPGAMMIATYTEDPDGKAPEELMSSAGIVLPDGVPMPEGLAEQRVHGGSYARDIHLGAYDVLGDVWTRFLGEALPAHGFVLTPGLSLEIYRSDMRSTPLEQWRTDLLVPVE